MSIFQDIKKFVLDTLFPITCINCGQDDMWLCARCLEDTELLSFQLCPKCENAITTHGQKCRSCRSNFALDNLIVATRYQENNLNKLVHLYKYRFVEDLHVPLGKILAKAILQSRLPLPDIILSVPLHSRRLRWRGFNQSELLADYLSKNLTPGFEIPLAKKLLCRKKYTSPQMKLTKYADRLSNLRNAFVCEKSVDLRGQTILLVDDIATTGATLLECAKVLKQNGAKKVFAAVIARQEMKN